MLICIFLQTAEDIKYLLALPSEFGVDITIRMISLGEVTDPLTERVPTEAST